MQALATYINGIPASSLEWIASIITIFGTLLVTFGTRWVWLGFVLYLVANVVWFIYTTRKRNWGQFTMFAVGTLVCSYGLLHWYAAA